MIDPLRSVKCPKCQKEFIAADGIWGGFDLLTSPCCGLVGKCDVSNPELVKFFLLHSPKGRDRSDILKVVAFMRTPDSFESVPLYETETVNCNPDFDW